MTLAEQILQEGRLALLDAYRDYTNEDLAREIQRLKIKAHESDAYDSCYRYREEARKLENVKLLRGK
jgi:hypothetical protein